MTTQSNSNSKFVKGYARGTNTPYFYVTTCDDKNLSNNCMSVETGHYLVMNSNNIMEHTGYMSTPDKTRYFVPQDTSLSQLSSRLQPSSRNQCLRIDPCTPAMADKCCDPMFHDPLNNYYVRFAGDVSSSGGTRVASQEQGTKQESNIAQKANKSNKLFYIILFSIIGFLVLVILGIAIYFMVRKR